MQDKKPCSVFLQTNGPKLTLNPTLISFFSSLHSYFRSTPTSAIAHHWTFASTALPRNVLLLFQHGTWFCYFTMELASTFAPPRNHLSGGFFFVVSASFSSFFVAMVCGGDSWLRLRLWFMLRASSYTFFSSIRDSWFVLKVVFGERVVPRVLVVQYLLSKGLVRKDANLFKPFGMSDVVFLQKYVGTFKQETPRDDICLALESLGFDDYAEPSRRYLDRYRGLEVDKSANQEREAAQKRRIVNFDK
ncbi:hypothetical protein VNO80_06195 [Phaseolus coccineus]|uniref:Uncharacterized protein n=1 Tax=Phaseolus coccineus TaxID=3886 RepID=A0AAN9NHA7_PHACN